MGAVGEGNRRTSVDLGCEIPHALLADEKSYRTECQSLAMDAPAWRRRCNDDFAVRENRGGNRIEWRRHLRARSATQRARLLAGCAACRRRDFANHRHPVQAVSDARLGANHRARGGREHRRGPRRTARSLARRTRRAHSLRRHLALVVLISPPHLRRNRSALWYWITYMDYGIQGWYR